MGFPGPSWENICADESDHSRKRKATQKLLVRKISVQVLRLRVPRNGLLEEKTLRGISRGVILAEVLVVIQ